MAARRSKKKELERTKNILDVLADDYRHAECALEYQNAFELLVATILSAQCTDVRVNMVTPRLFAAYPTPAAMAEAGEQELQQLIRSTGFFRNKARNLLGMARLVVSDFGGEIPTTMAEMLTLPGVARKTANVVLGTAFGIPAGVVVDTHVSRISQRLHLTGKTAPVPIEKDLMVAIPKDRWIEFSHQLIHHGRQVCRARKPLCSDCRLAEFCPSFALLGAS